MAASHDNDEVDDDGRSYVTEGTPEVMYSGDFGSLVPDNPEATTAFNNVVAFLEDSATESIEPYHKRFVSVEIASPPSPSPQTSPLLRPIPDAPSPSSSLSSDHPRGPAPRGRYRLSLDVLPEGPGAAWRIGKGSARYDDDGRGIDLLLVPQGQHKGLGVANVHALISIHGRSGAFMLRSTSRRPIVYLSAAEDGSDLVLRHMDQTVLYRAVNRLRIGALDYLLTIGVEQESHFKLLRNQFISTFLEETSLPHPMLDVVPQSYHQRMCGYVVHKPISAGAFGMVRSAVDGTTGEPVAVKRLSCKGARDTSAAGAEARMAGLFSSDNHDSGVIPLLAAWCEHGVRPACGESPEDVFLAMPLAITDFGHAPWPSIPMASRLALLRYTLLGIARIHAAGIIHRDVSVKNLLVRSLDPPVAAVCDFGKATDRPHSTNTAIGPIETVAPEVWMSAPHNPYGRSVDMWSLGYAWLSTFGHLRGIVSASGSLKTDATRALGIRQELDRRARSGAMPADLGNLLRQMMDVDPRQRYTAEQALRHPTWNLLSKTVSDEGDDRAKRRRLLTPEEEEPVGACPADESTIPDTEASLAATVQIPGRPGESAVV